MSVYNYGANNPVLYNDPMGDMFGRSLKGTDGNYHVSWVSQMQWNDKGFYDWGLGNSEGGGGGGSGISNLRDVRGLFVSTILANTQFGELPKQNKNGEFGFWKKYTFDPGIPGDGKVNLAGIGIGQMWIPFQSYQQNIEDITRNLISQNLYVEAYRNIFNSYKQIGNGLIEGRDYHLWPTAVNKGGFQTQPYAKIREGGNILPTTVIGKGLFDNFMNGTGSFGGLVRAIYHESVHINLMLGRIDGFKAIYPTIGDGKSIHEVIASYFQITNSSLPPMNQNEINFISVYGNGYFNSIQNTSISNYYNYMKVLFLSNIKPK